MQPPSHNQRTAYPLFWLGVLMVLFWAGVACLLTGCSTKPSNPSVNVQPAMRQVDKAARLSTDAREAVTVARTEARAEDPNMALIIQRLDDADMLLAQQQLALESANTELEAAHKAAAITQQELDRIKRESDKYREKYLKLTKYRWLVVSIVIVAVLGVIARLKGLFI